MQFNFDNLTREIFYRGETSFEASKEINCDFATLFSMHRHPHGAKCFFTF